MIKTEAYEEGVLLKYGAWQMMLSWNEAEKLKAQLFAHIYKYKRNQDTEN